jgi:hypothetical protein
MPDVEIVSAGASEIRLPADAFEHMDPTASMALHATLADGRPLPAWIVFDPANGTFRVTPPEGLDQALEVRVIARDAQGNEAVLLFTIDIDADNDANRGSSGFDGRSSLSEQLRAAARPLGLSERLLALSRAAQATQRMQR